MKQNSDVTNTDFFDYRPRKCKRKRQRQPLPVWVYALLAAVVALVLLLGLSVERGNQRLAQTFDAAVADVNKDVPGLLAAMKYRQTKLGMTPDVVWDGTDARLLHLDAAVHRNSLIRAEYAEWSMLAVTPAGRFFKVRYELWKVSDCGARRKCVTLSEFLPLKREDAKEALFKAGEKAAYEELFGEPMPPVEVKA